MKWLQMAVVLTLAVSCSSNVPTPKATGPAQTEVLSVQGLHCEGCVNTIQTTVSALNGVNDIQVSLEKETATVTYVPEHVDREAIVAAIVSKGYTVPE